MTCSGRGVRFKVAVLIVLAITSSVAVWAADSPDPAEQECIRDLAQAFEALEAGDGESAINHYRNALGKAISKDLRFQALLGLGSSYAAVGESDQAIGALKKARDLAPDDASVWYTLGTVYASAGRVDDAISALAEAGFLAPDLAAAHYDRCILLSA